MSKSSSKPVRVVYDYSPLVDAKRYFVFYSSGVIRSYDFLPECIDNLLVDGPCLMWRDGDAFVYDIMEVNVDV